MTKEEAFDILIRCTEYCIEHGYIFTMQTVDMLEAIEIAKTSLNEETGYYDWGRST